jgi:hypothetical protein
VDCSGAVPPELKSFFATQDAWTRQQVEKHPEDAYWQYIGAFVLVVFCMCLRILVISNAFVLI